MTVQIVSVTLDCSDALVVGTFWSAAFGRPLDPQASSEYAAIGFAGRRDTSGWSLVDRENDPTFLFVRVPDGKVAKNRIHLDVTAPDVDGEVRRLGRARRHPRRGHGRVRLHVDRDERPGGQRVLHRQSDVTRIPGADAGLPSAASPVAQHIWKPTPRAPVRPR